MTLIDIDKTLNHIFGTGSETQLSIKTTDRLRQLRDELNYSGLVEKFISDPHIFKGILSSTFCSIFASIEEADETVDKLSKECSFGVFDQDGYEIRIASVPESPSFQIYMIGSYVYRSRISIGLNVGLLNVLSTWAQKTEREGDRFTRLLAVGLIEAAMVVYNELYMVADPDNEYKDLYKGVHATKIYNGLTGRFWTDRRWNSTGREMSILKTEIAIRDIHTSFEGEPLKQGKFFPSFTDCDMEGIDISTMAHIVPSFIRFTHQGPSTRNNGAWTGEEISYIDILSHGTKGSFVTNKFYSEEVFIQKPSKEEVDRVGSRCIVRIADYKSEIVKTYTELKFPRSCLNYGENISLAIFKEVELLEKIKESDNHRLYNLMKQSRYGDPLDNLEALTWPG